MESQIVNEWTAQARAEGEAKGVGNVLLRMLKGRFKQVPADLRKAIRAIKDADRLLACIDLVFDARSLCVFRQQAGF